MKIIRTCTKLVEYNEVEILGVLHRRYTSWHWTFLSDGRWLTVRGKELTRLESDFNELVRSMARGSGKTLTDIAKMISPLTQAMMELSFIETDADMWFIRLRRHDQDMHVGSLLKNVTTGNWFFSLNQYYDLSLIHI